MQGISKRRPAVIGLAAGMLLAGSTIAAAQGPGPRPPSATQSLPTLAPPDPSLPGRGTSVGRLSPRPATPAIPSDTMTRPGTNAAPAGLGPAPTGSTSPARAPSSAAGAPWYAAPAPSKKPSRLKRVLPFLNREYDTAVAPSGYRDPVTGRTTPVARPWLGRSR